MELRPLIPLALLVGAQGWAQSLQFTSAPQTLSYGMPSAPVTVSRFHPDGSLWSTGAPSLSFTVSSDSPQGEFSPTASAFSWSSTHTVSFAANSGVSAPFFYRDGRLSTATLTVDGDGSFQDAVRVYPVSPNGFADDLELGGIELFDDPPGRWSEDSTDTGNGLAVDPEAAHRGALGLRFVDTSAASGSVGLGAHATRFLARMLPNTYARAWVRVASTNAQGTFVFLNLHGAGPISSPLLDLHLDPPATVRLSGFGLVGGSPQYANSPNTADLTVGQWHLIEVALVGAGTASAERKLWVDGQHVATRTVNWTGVQPNKLSVGAPWYDDRTFMGSLHFDDVRVSAAPPASRITLPHAPSLVSGVCAPIAFGLAHSEPEGPAPAPYDVSLSLAVDGGAELYADPACTTPTPTVTIPAEATQGTAYVHAAQAGVATVTATHPDFLDAPEPGTLVFSPPPPDGGDDGGVTGTPGPGPEGPGAPPQLVAYAATEATCGMAYDSAEPGPVALGAGPLVFSLASDADAVPEGMSIDAHTGRVHWPLVRLATGTYRYRRTVHGPGGVDSQELLLNVDCTPRHLRVGCGCQADASPLPWLEALLLLALVRKVRRGARNVSH